MSTPAEEQEGPVIRDKRRIDPITGRLRERGSGPAPGAATAATAATAAATAAPGTAAGAADRGPTAGLPGDAAEAEARRRTESQVAELTADLQRLQAEYANYRRRVERDRQLVRETALVNVLTNLLPVLDDVGRARDHGELEGGFKSVGEALEAVVSKLGLERFGAVGEPFDPTRHEALVHTHSVEVSEPTCVEVFQPGYRVGDRIVRAARVAVADPQDDEPVEVAASDAAVAGAALTDGDQG